MRENGLADEDLDEYAAYRRYLLFKDIKFGMVPERILKLVLIIKLCS